MFWMECIELLSGWMKDQNPFTRGQNWNYLSKSVQLGKTNYFVLKIFYDQSIKDKLTIVYVELPLTCLIFVQWFIHDHICWRDLFAYHSRGELICDLNSFKSTLIYGELLLCLWHCIPNISPVTSIDYPLLYVWTRRLTKDIRALIEIEMDNSL